MPNVFQLYARLKLNLVEIHRKVIFLFMTNSRFLFFDCVCVCVCMVITKSGFVQYFFVFNKEHSITEGLNVQLTATMPQWIKFMQGLQFFISHKVICFSIMHIVQYLVRIMNASKSIKFLPNIYLLYMYEFHENNHFF